MTPSRSSVGNDSGVINSPQSLARGMRFSSSKRTRMPRPASVMAALVPAGPPPMMMASYEVISDYRKLMKSVSLIIDARDQREAIRKAAAHEKSVQAGALGVPGHLAHGEAAQHRRRPIVAR